MLVPTFGGLLADHEDGGEVFCRNVMMCQQKSGGKG
jgi:hypothetical protein